MTTRWQPTASLAVLKKRARMLQEIRAFFSAREVMEVETPVLSTYATTDPHLDSLQTTVGDTTCYLNTSPEYCMKRLLANQSIPIYQITKAFRDDEYSRYHNPEFTMLEWYRPGYSLTQLMDEVEALIKALSAGRFSPSCFYRLSYQQAFEQYAGFNPHQCNVAQCRQVLRDHNVEIPEGMPAAQTGLDDWLDWILTQLVLPALPTQQFVFLYDYPASQASLAKIEETDMGYPLARRFELLYGELELANAFYELTDAGEQEQRFRQERQQRQIAGKPAPAMDQNLLAALAHGLAECSGVALGLDRLLMVLCNSQSIDEVLAFSWQRI